MRAAPVLASLAALLAALSACAGDAAPPAPAADPSPAARSQAASPSTTPTPTPAPPAPTPTPSLAPIPSAFVPGDRSSASQPPFEAPAFSLLDGFGERVVLEDLLADHQAVVLVFYRGFF